jgi:SAM-dependent methyltransferase
MLGEIAQANRWFGGRAALYRGLETLIDQADRGRRLTLLDIGTGAGDLPAAATTWCGRRGVTLTCVGIERHSAAARLARDNGVSTAVACGTRPPFPAASCDIVLLSQLLHHLDDESALVMLAAAGTIARRGVIVADLRPSPVAGAAFRAAGAIMGFDRRTVEDGRTSLARGRDLKALDELLIAAGVDGATVSRLPFARIVASWRVRAR